jgi:hypothetical protein
MVNTDIFNREEIIILLDKPYLIQFTFKSVYALEERYGPISAAFKALLNDDIKQAIEAAEVFLYVLTGLPPEKTNEHLDVFRFNMAVEGILKALKRDFPDKKEESDNAEATHDWDSLYYIGRYWLGMSDDEFWATTPRRFCKLQYLWMLDHGKTEPEIYMGEVEY